MHQIKRRGFIASLVGLVSGLFASKAVGGTVTVLDRPAGRPVEAGRYHVFMLPFRGKLRLEIEHVCGIAGSKIFQIKAIHKDIPLNATDDERAIALGDLMTKFIATHSCIKKGVDIDA